MSENRAQDSRATEDLVTLPLATLQQLVQYCAQVVRESKELKSRVPDPERDGIPNDMQTPQNNPSNDGNPWGGANIFNLNSDYITRLPRREVALMEEVWRKVVPFKLGTFQEWPDEMIEREEPMLAQCRGEEDIHLLFRSRYHDLEPQRAASASKRLLRHLGLWEGYEPYQKSAIPFNFGVMVVLIEGLEHGRLSIGAILERCYQLRVLTPPPRDSEPRNYLSHI